MFKRIASVVLVAGGFTLVTANLVPGDSPAQDPSQRGQPGPAKTSADAQASVPSMQADLRASQIIGLDLRNEQGELLGKVQDLVVNLRSGAAPCVIVRYGGTLRIGELRVAVPLRDIKWYPEIKMLTLAATKEEFAAASQTPKGAWASLAEEDWAKDIDRFYGHPAMRALLGVDRQAFSPPDEERDYVRHPADTGETGNLTPVKPMEDDQATELPAKSGGNAPKPPPSAHSTQLPIPRHSDSDLASQVRSLIAQYLGPRAAGDIQVAVESGVVTLQGTVSNIVLKQDIENRVAGISGVLRVDDEISAANE